MIIQYEGLFSNEVTFWYVESTLPLGKLGDCLELHILVSYYFIKKLTI